MAITLVLYTWTMPSLKSHQRAFIGLCTPVSNDLGFKVGGLIHILPTMIMIKNQALETDFYDISGLQLGRNDFKHL